MSTELIPFEGKLPDSTELETMSRHQAKEALGSIAYNLYYFEGNSIEKTRELMISDPRLRELFELGGYVKPDGEIGYTEQTCGKWAKMMQLKQLRGDKRGLAATLFAHQLRGHLEVQKKVFDHIVDKDKVGHTTRYVEISKLIGQMLPGFLQSESHPLNITNIMLADDEKKKMMIIHAEATKEVEEFEQKLIEGQISGDE